MNDHKWGTTFILHPVTSFTLLPIWIPAHHFFLIKKGHMLE